MSWLQGLCPMYVLYWYLGRCKVGSVLAPSFQTCCSNGNQRGLKYPIFEVFGSNNHTYPSLFFGTRGTWDPLGNLLREEWQKAADSACSGCSILPCDAICFYLPPRTAAQERKDVQEMYIYIYTCIHTYVCKCKCKCKCKSVYMYMYICANNCRHKHMHTCVYLTSPGLSLTLASQEPLCSFGAKISDSRRHPSVFRDPRDV